MVYGLKQMLFKEIKNVKKNNNLNFKIYFFILQNSFTRTNYKY